LSADALKGGPRHGVRLGRDIALLILAGLWLVYAWSQYQETGLFNPVGGDFGVYLVQAQIFRNEGPTEIYDTNAVARQQTELETYMRHPLDADAPEITPYPPLFAWLLGPFTLLPPPAGLAVWIALSLLALAQLARRVAEEVPGRPGRLVGLVLLVTFPIAIGLYYGQLVLILGAAFAEAYVAFRARRDMRAGLWLGALIFKPQYLILLAPLLLWKRRWAALAGMCLCAAAIVLACVLIAGVPSLLALTAAIRRGADFHGQGEFPTQPQVMINWRALLLLLERVGVVPTIPDDLGALLALLLGALSALLVVVVWRGDWRPESRSFAPRMAVLVLGTLLAAYHSHGHGAILLALPLASTLANCRLSWLCRATLLTAIVVPTLVVTTLHRELLADRLLAVLVLLSFVAMVIDLLSSGQATVRALSDRTWWPSSADRPPR
jgi:hypothetical protein